MPQRPCLTRRVPVATREDNDRRLRRPAAEAGRDEGAALCNRFEALDSVSDRKPRTRRLRPVAGDLAARRR